MFASVLCSVRSDSHDLSGIHKLLIDVSVEAILLDDERVGNFQRPVDGFTLSILRIEVNPAVRVPLNNLVSFRRGSAVSDRIPPEGMMR